MVTRRSFIHHLSMLLAGTLTTPLSLRAQTALKIMTVKGMVNANAMGKTLVHEHILVDFIGASNYDPTRWDRKKVIEKVLPYLSDVRSAGCDTFVDCTPNYLGRDPQLLLELSNLSGLHIVTNTGYYGGSDNKYLAGHAFTETADALAARWIKEWDNGIDGTSVRPGFMKISVNPDHLSPISRKLVQAAARTHRKTGLTILSHTGPAVAALEEIKILEQEGVSPSAFVWVHAQNEKDWSHYITAVEAGAWVSLDGLNDESISSYVEMLTFIKTEGYLRNVLVSHDAGWYEPGKPDGGNFRKFTTLFDLFLPALRDAGFTTKDIRQIIEVNPGEAFAIKVREIGKQEKN